METEKKSRWIIVWRIDIPAKLHTYKQNQTACQSTKTDYIMIMIKQKSYANIVGAWKQSGKILPEWCWEMCFPQEVRQAIEVPEVGDVPLHYYFIHTKSRTWNLNAKFSYFSNIIPSHEFGPATYHLHRNI